MPHIKDLKIQVRMNYQERLQITSADLPKDIGFTTLEDHKLCIHQGEKIRVALFFP